MNVDLESSVRHSKRSAVSAGTRCFRVAVEGPVRQIRSLAIDGDPVPPCNELWPIIGGGRQVGTISSAAYSPDFRTNVAIGMVRMTHWDDGTKVQVDTPHGMRSCDRLGNPVLQPGGLA
jgi:dimethylsulfoniopropionate demethylase